MAQALGRRDLRDDEVLRFLRFNIVESAAGTFTEQSIDTQLSIDRGLIWMIHFIEWYIRPEMIDDPAQNAHEALEGQITRESQTALIPFSDPDLIASFGMQKDRSATIGTPAGPDTYLATYPITQNYAPPLVYAAQTIYIGIVGTSATPNTVRGRMGFTLRRVSDKFFYRVAQALIS